MKSDNKPTKPLKDKNQHIQVFVRVRPSSLQDKQKYLPTVVECPSNREVVVKDKPTSLTSKTFTFDRVFGTQSKQIDIYRNVVSPLIEEVLAGYNCTVFAYGQTGTGKTYTMEGERTQDPNITWENDPLCGIIPRTLSHLFDELRQQQVEFTVRVSFLELYNEELIDLLSPADDGTKIRIFEDVSKKGSVIIQGLEEITVHNKNDVYQILTKGSVKRQTAATLMNAHSSRSHTVFSITIHIKENLVGGDELLKTGKLNLVDLAGSENIGRSGAVDKRAREAGNINQSLLTLGRVITALVERTPHIPYRESKLTRLLQDSLGGRTKTCFIATISPVSSNLEETLSTLDYAHRAKNITNRPEINQKLTKKELLKEYTEEIERLRRDLLATREKNGVFLDPGEFERMTVKMSELEQENAGKLAHIKALREEMEKMETLCNDLNIKVEEKSTELTHKTEMLVETEDRLQRTQTKLVKTVREKEVNEHLVNHHAEKEKLLGEQAMSLMKVADQSTTDVSRLHDKLARKRSVEEGNKSRSEQFKDNFHRNFGRMDDWLEKLLVDHTSFCGNLRSALGEQQDQKISELTIMSEHLTSQVQLFTDLLHGMESKSAEAMRQAQYWIQHRLEVVRTTTGASAEALRSSLTDLILPPLQGIMQRLREYQSNLQELSSQVNDMIREREHQSEVYSVETMDAVNSLEESVTQYSLQQKQEIEWLRTASQNYLEDSQTETKEMQTQMQAMREMLDRMFALTESKQHRANLTATELGEGLNRCENSCEKFSAEMKKVSESLKKKQTKHSVSNKQYSEKLLSVFSDFVEKSTVGISNTQHLREEAVSSCWTAVNANEDAWREQYHAAEEELREHSEMLNRYLQSDHEQTQTLSNKVRETAEVQESLLESQRNSFRSFVQQRQEELEEECSAVRERGQVLSDELRKRELELNHFFTSELVEDRPTGETPPRRDYVYPRRLVASSPRERVIQRVLAQMDSAARLLSVIPSTEKEKEENSDKLSTSTRSLPEIVDHPATQPLSETSSLQKAASESNVSVPADESTSENQVENQENLGPAEIKKNSSQIIETQRRRLKYRKPLIAKNSE